MVSVNERKSNDVDIEGEIGLSDLRGHNVKDKWRI